MRQRKQPGAPGVPPTVAAAAGKTVHHTCTGCHGGVRLSNTWATFPPPCYVTRVTPSIGLLLGRTRGAKGVREGAGARMTVLGRTLSRYIFWQIGRRPDPHPRVADDRGVDRGGHAPAGADDQPGPGCAPLSDHDDAGDPEPARPDSPVRAADRRYPRPQPPEWRQRADRHDGRRRSRLGDCSSRWACSRCWSRWACRSSITLAGPWSQRLLRDYATLVRTDLIGQVIQPWRFTEPEAKLTVHIRDRTPDGDLLGLLMHDARDPKQVATYLAERAQIVKQGGAALHAHGEGPYRAPERQRDGTPDHRLHRPTRSTSTSSSSAPIPCKPRARASATRTSCCGPIPMTPSSNRPPAGCRSELHERFSSALYPISFVLIVMAFIGSAQTTRAEPPRGRGCSLRRRNACRMLGISATNTAAVRPSMAFVLYAIPVVAGVIAAVAVQRQIVPRPPAEALGCGEPPTRRSLGRRRGGSGRAQSAAAAAQSRRQLHVPCPHAAHSTWPSASCSAFWARSWFVHA